MNFRVNLGNITINDFVKTLQTLSFDDVTEQTLSELLNKPVGVNNVEDYVKGTITDCYIGPDEEYYTVSIESSGKCIKVSDESLLQIIYSGGGGGGESPLSILVFGWSS